MYPARTDYRGFTEGLSDKAYKNIAAYMLKNSEELYKESVAEKN